MNPNSKLLWMKYGLKPANKHVISHL